MAAKYGRLPPQEERKFSGLLADITAGVSYKMTLNPASPSRIKGKRRFHLAAQTVLTECLETILDHSMLPGVMKISHLSRGHRAFVLEYLRRRVDNHLQTWFNDPAHFRTMLRATSSVVSGSTVLAFALGVDWGVQDLDIYVGGEFDDEDAPAGDCAKLLAYLVEVEGFRPQTAYGETRDVTFDGIIPTPAPTITDQYGDDWGPEVIRTVYKLVRERSVPGYKEPITVHIDVIEGAFDNPIRIISEFHSTQVMNWMSADNITIAYPVLTFAMKGVVKQNRLSFDGPKDPSWKEKYSARGFRIFDNHNSLIVPCGTSCTKLTRSSYDIGCMRMPYGQGSVADQFEETYLNLVRGKSLCGHDVSCFGAPRLPLSRSLPRDAERSSWKDHRESSEDGGRGDRPHNSGGSGARGQPETRGSRMVQVPSQAQGRGERRGRGGTTVRGQTRGGGRGGTSQLPTPGYGRGNGTGQSQVQGRRRGRGQSNTRGGVGGEGQPQSPVGRGGHPQTRGRGERGQSESRGARGGRGQSYSRGGTGSRSRARSGGRFHT